MALDIRRSGAVRAAEAGRVAEPEQSDVCARKRIHEDRKCIDPCGRGRNGSPGMCMSSKPVSRLCPLVETRLNLRSTGLGDEACARHGTRQLRVPPPKARN